MDTREEPRAALVVNTRSRSGERAFEHARDRLRGLGVRVEAEYDLHDPARLPETVREAADEYEMVILGGGDGTVSSSVDFLAGRETVLGLLPLGTANDFARTLGVPTDLDRACETIASGKLVDIDLGLAGDNYYVNLASVGLSAGVTRALTSRLKRVAGSAAYPLAAIKAFLKHEPFRARLTFPDGDHEPIEHERLLQVAVGNGRFYGGGMVVSPSSGIDDSTLDVYAIRLGRHRDLLGVARYLKSGDFVRGESVSHYETSRVLVETEPHMPVNVDGELVAQTPQEFSVARNALHVMVPPASSAARYEGPAAKR
jgi:diacylglycerol kinase (ATP)